MGLIWAKYYVVFCYCIATTRERAGRDVERVTSGVRTRILNECRIVVFGPRADLTSRLGVVGTQAAVSVRVEMRTGTMARHHPPGAISCPDGQLGRAHAVQVGHTVGRFAIVLAFFRVREIPGRHHPDRQVVAIQHRHAVEVQSVGPGELHLGKGRGRHNPGPATVDLVP